MLNLYRMCASDMEVYILILWCRSSCLQVVLSWGMLPGVEYVTGCSAGLRGCPYLRIACIARMAHVCRHGPLCQVGMCGLCKCVRVCPYCLHSAIGHVQSWQLWTFQFRNPNSKQARTQHCPSLRSYQSPQISLWDLFSAQVLPQIVLRSKHPSPSLQARSCCMFVHTFKMRF